MDIIGTIQNGGVTIKNPNYTKSGKNGPKYYKTANLAASPSFGDVATSVVTPQSYNLTHMGDMKEYTDRGIIPGRMDTLQELNKERAEKQSAWEQLGNMLMQATVGEVGLGTAIGFSNLFDAAINLINPETQDYTNPVSSALTEWQEQLREAFPIYMKEEGETLKTGGMLDFGWWMSNAPSVISSLSLLIPARAGGALLGKVGNVLGKIGRASVKGTRAEAVVSKIANNTKLGRTLKATQVENTTANAIYETGVTAGFSRILENYQESAQVYKDINELAKEQFSTEEGRKKFIEDNTNSNGEFEYARREKDGQIDWNGIAHDIANQAANRDFVDNLGNFVFDFWQMYTLRNFVKGFKDKDITPELERFNTQTARGLGKSASELAAQQTTTNQVFNWLRVGGENILSTAGAEVSEGIEEMVNFVAQEEGMHLGNVLLGNEVDNVFDERLAQYLRDGQFWDSAFWGFLGGIVFQGLGSGFNKLSNKLKHVQYDEVQDKKNEITSRVGRVQDLIKKLKLIEEGYDIYNPILQENTPTSTTPSTKTGKNKLYRTFKEEIKDNGDVGDEATLQLEAKKKLMQESLTDIIINAAAEGNLGLVKPFLNDENVREMLKQAGALNSQDEQIWADYVTEKIENVSKRMDDVITYLADLNVPAHYVRMIAVNNVRSQLELEQNTSDINALEHEIDEYLKQAQISIDSNTADEYKRKIKAETYLAYLRELKKQKANLEKLKTISAKIGLRNIDRQIKTVLSIVEDEFYESFEDLDTYVNYRFNEDNGVPNDEATAIKDKWIEEHSDPNLSDQENATIQGLAFDKIVSITSYSNLFRQDETLAKLYNQLAQFRISEALNRESIKLSKEKVDEMVAQYNNMFDRAKHEASKKVGDIINKLFDKYDIDEVYNHIQNPENKITGITEKELKSLDEALKALDLLNDDSGTYRRGIDIMYQMKKRGQQQNANNAGQNPDPGTTSTAKFKLHDRVKYNGDSGEIVAIGPGHTRYRVKFDNGTDTWIDEDDLESDSSLPFSPGSTPSGSRGTVDPVAVINRAIANANPYYGPESNQDPDDNQVWATDVVYIDDGNGGQKMMIAVDINNNGLIALADPSIEDSTSPYGYKVLANITEGQIIKDETRDIRVANRQATIEAQKRAILNSPDVSSWNYALAAFVSIPKNPDGSINYNAIGAEVMQKLMAAGMSQTDATHWATYACTKIRDRYDKPGTIASAVADLLFTKTYTSAYVEAVKNFIDKYIAETGKGNRVNNRRYINLQALLRYARQNGVDNSLAEATFNDLKNFLIMESNRKGNRMFVLLDNPNSLDDPDFIENTKLTQKEAQEKELSTVPAQRVDIYSIMQSTNAADFNRIYDSLKVGQNLNYRVENNNLLLVTKNNEVIGRIPIVEIDSDKSSKTYGSFVQVNDGWITDVKPVNGRVESRFITWLKNNLSDSNSDLFKLVFAYGVAETDIEKEQIIKKIKSTHAWADASKMKLKDSRADDKTLIDGLYKLFAYNSNSNTTEEFKNSYDNWARKLLNSYSNVLHFVQSLDKTPGEVVIDYLTEGTQIQVAENEADVPSKTIANLDHRIHKLASFHPSRTNITTGLDVSGTTDSLFDRKVAAKVSSLNAGRSFLVIPNRSGSPSLVYVYPVGVNEVSSTGGMELISALKNEMYMLMKKFGETGSQEDFNTLADFVSKVFSIDAYEASMFTPKVKGKFNKGMVTSEFISIGLGNDQFRIHNRSFDKTKKTSICLVNGVRLNLDRPGIISAINSIFNSFNIQVENAYIKNDNKTNADSGIFSWRNGKLTIKTMFYNKTFDSYNHFMLSNDLVKCRTKIENGSNFTPANASMQVKLVTGNIPSPSTTPTNNTADEVSKIFDKSKGNKSKLVLQKIFRRSRALNNVLSLPIFEENINFVNIYFDENGVPTSDRNRSVIAITLLQDMTIAGKQYKKGDIIYSKKFIEEVASDPNRAGLDIIHENLHKKLIDPENRKILRNIARIYDEYLDSLEDDKAIKKFVAEQNANGNNITVDQVKQFFNNLNNAISGHQTSDQDIEEFLVQSLTNRTLANYLNSVEATNYNKDDSKKSLWQKILEFVQKLFGMETREGSLREKEFYALSDLFDDSAYTLKDRTIPVTPTDTGGSTTPVTPSPVRKGRVRRGMLSNVGEVETKILNIDSYIESFHPDLRAEITSLKDSGTLNFICR